MYSDNYRRKLSEYLEQEIILECSDFRIDKDSDLGRRCLLLLSPIVIRIGGRSPDKKWVIDHLWVNVPHGESSLLVKCAEYVANIRITGMVCVYQYAMTGKLQVGVRADSIKALNVRKEIARRYNLSHDMEPTTEMIKRIISQEEIRKAIAGDGCEKGLSPGLEKYEIQKIIRSSDKRHVDVQVSNLSDKYTDLNHEELRKKVISNISNLSEYYVFVKAKSGECLGYGYVKPVDRKTIEVGHEMYKKYQGQEIEKSCVAMFAKYVRSQYKTTRINVSAARSSCESNEPNYGKTLV